LKEIIGPLKQAEQAILESTVKNEKAPFEKKKEGEKKTRRLGSREREEKQKPREETPRGVAAGTAN